VSPADLELVALNTLPIVTGWNLLALRDAGMQMPHATGLHTACVINDSGEPTQEAKFRVA
jgi:hypothetical protein